MKTQKKIIPCKRIARKAANLVSLYNSGHHRNARKQVGIYFINSYWLRRFSISLFLLYALAVGSDLRAQDYKVDQVLPSHRWDIGIDIIPFLKPEMSLDFILKKSFKGGLNAIRFRTAPQFNKYRNKTFPGIGGVTKVNASFGFGVERRQVLGRFTIYYGSDINFMYRLNSDNIGIGVNQKSPTLVRNYYRNIGVGTSAFIGGKYFLNHRISLSIESTLALGYYWTRRETGEVDYDLKPINLLIEESSGLDISSRGSAAFFLTYHF
ncbi:MAG: hypothetical protein MUE30_16840 [Spirosomaceae bacterium]|jgi:hypothetical protein|nr:hypothetical protein [Spirosomataceae bacterium]